MSSERNVPKPGEWIIGWYPTRNVIGDKAGRVPRNLMCLSVRDLHKEPLALSTVERRPLTHRGRFLMFAWDEDIGETRCFYLAQLLPSKDVAPMDSLLQVIGFDDGAPADGLETHGPEFAATAIQRAALATACRELRQRGKEELFRIRARDAQPSKKRKRA
jgi:hypothetical protein